MLKLCSTYKLLSSTNLTSSSYTVYLIDKIMSVSSHSNSFNLQYGIFSIQLTIHLCTCTNTSNSFLLQLLATLVNNLTKSLLHIHSNLTKLSKYEFHTNFVDYCGKFSPYYAGIMLNTFATYYAQNYAGIIGSNLLNSPLFAALVPKY